MWQHPACFLSGVGCITETSGRGKCKQTKKPFVAGERTLTFVAHSTTAHVKLEVAGGLLAPVFRAAKSESTIAALRARVASGALDALTDADLKVLEASLTERAMPVEDARAADTFSVSETPATTAALADVKGGEGKGKETKQQPAIGVVVKATGKVAWKWAGNLCYGTLIAKSETKTHAYARTQRGNVKTLTKGGDYWWQL